MPRMQGRENSLAAGGTLANVLTGEDYEFLPNDALISVAVAASAEDVVVTVKADSDALANEVEAAVEQATGRLIFDEDMILDQEPVPAGSRLALAVRNDGGAAADISWAVKVEPIPAGAFG